MGLRGGAWGTDTIHSGGELPFLEQPLGFGRGFRVELVELRSCGRKKPSEARGRELRGQARPASRPRAALPQEPRLSGEVALRL